MDLDTIEYKVAQNEINAMQLFTEMKQIIQVLSRQLIAQEEGYDCYSCDYLDIPSDVCTTCRKWSNHTKIDQ